MRLSEGLTTNNFENTTNNSKSDSLAGFTPTPYQSGESAREQGITKSGNRHVRWMTTELAWSWLRFQRLSGNKTFIEKVLGRMYGKLRTDLLDNRLLAMLLETSKRLIC